jgi:predicted nucleic acid-binding protein
MPVVDASVLVAAFNATEDAHGASVAWLERALASQRPIYAPAVVLPEVAAAVARNTGREDLATRIVARVQAGPITLVPVTEPLAQRAARIAGAFGVRGCDAVYVAVAEELGEELVTLDREQLARGGQVVPVASPAADLDRPRE